MAKIFNVNGVCIPDRHYMVDLGTRLKTIKTMIDAGEYFTVNRARQYGKTTMLKALKQYLKDDYSIILLDFQNFDEAKFQDGHIFSVSFASSFLRELKKNNSFINDSLQKAINGLKKNINSLNSYFSMKELFEGISDICAASDKPVVLMIDEVDSVSDNQVFLDFLAQLRAGYLGRDEMPAFQSVILAGVYDVRSVKRKIRPEEEHRENSPWNIAARFTVDMAFSAQETAGMLKEYEADYHTGMDIALISKLIYEYTSGYPYLVSCLCKIIDEELAGTEDFPDKSSAWTIKGFYEAEKRLVKEDNTLYQSMIAKLKLYPKLKTVLYELLFTGKPIPYVATNEYIKDAAMFGFIRNENDTAVIFNPIFESVLYNYFISEEFSENKMYRAAVQEKNQFIIGGHLDMKRVLEKFVETFDSLYGDKDDAFLEDAGRRYFILFLKPIINGVGNYSVESVTRNNERMDLVVYYRGEQYVVELKLWRGNAYNERGEEQLSNYLEYFHLKKGYMLSFNFNKKKEVGVKEIQIGDKVLVEAVV